jgi:hypothetical protein
VSRFQAVEAQTRAQLVAQISKIPTAAAAYPTDILNAMSTDDLQRLAQVLNLSAPVDHSGRGLVAASVAVTGAGEYPKAPSIYDTPTPAKEKAN